MNVWPLPRITFGGLSSLDEKRPTALIAHPAAWAAISKSVKLPLIIQAEPTNQDKSFVDYLASNLPTPAEVVYAVGDGLVIDVAKAVAAKNDTPLVIIPTAISSDTPFSAMATLQADGELVEQDTAPAQQVLIDLDLIKSAPPEQRAAGIVDVMSIVTGLLDWGYAAQKNKTTPDTKLVPWALGLAAAMGSQAIKSAAAIGKGDADSLQTLVGLIGLTLQLDNLLGHRRASPGIEHVFAQVVKAAPSVSHAERIGPGILIASALYNKDAAGMRAAVEAAGARLEQRAPVDR